MKLFEDFEMSIDSKSPKENFCLEEASGCYRTQLFICGEIIKYDKEGGVSVIKMAGMSK